MAYRRAALVAVLADVHGNLPALSAVLAEPDVAAADAVVLLGDIALGPMPAETLEVLAGLGERAIWVHGNCEREMVAAFDGVTVPGPNGPQASASAALIDRRHRDMLDRLPLALTLEIDGLGVCGFCHASPRRDDEMLLVDSPVTATRLIPSRTAGPGHPALPRVNHAPLPGTAGHATPSADSERLAAASTARAVLHRLSVYGCLRPRTPLRALATRTGQGWLPHRLGDSVQLWYHCPPATGPPTSSSSAC